MGGRSSGLDAKYHTSAANTTKKVRMGAQKKGIPPSLETNRYSAFAATRGCADQVIARGDSSRKHQVDQSSVKGGEFKGRGGATISGTKSEGSVQFISAVCTMEIVSDRVPRGSLKMVGYCKLNKTT